MTTESTAEAPAEKKSIVPGKYAGKYKNGGSDDVARFIKQEAGDGDKFSFDSFWELCRKNGIAEDKIQHYAGQIAENRQGAKGRARMTLRNMLAAKARKDKKLVKLDGSDDPVDGGKVAVSGAAAKAQEAKAEPAAEEPTSSSD